MKFLQKLLTLKNALICFMGIGVFFIISQTIQGYIALFLKVDPSFTGGVPALEFTNFPESSDIAGYTIFKPVTNARWQKNPDYWQLTFLFKNPEALSKDVQINIDLDNYEAEAAGKNPYDFSLVISDGKGKVFTNNGDFICETENHIMQNNTLLKIRIPLTTKRIMKVLGTKLSKHQILTDKSTGGLFVEANLK